MSAPGARSWPRVALALLGAALLLAAAAPLFAPGRLHVHGRFVDQAGYVTTARHLAETGELRSGILYPAHVREQRWRLYMPGPYWLLALSYRLLGYGPWTSILPAVLAYVLTAGLVFAAASRRYGTPAAVLATLLVASFPALLQYALTAMPQVPMAAASALVLAGVLLAPPRARAAVGALLVGVAFLFGELAALLAGPVVLLLALDPGGRRADGVPDPAARRRRLLAAALGGLGTVLLVVGLREWQVAAGKGVVPLSWVTRGFFNYHDAFLPPEPELSPGQWLAALTQNVGRNLGITANLVVRDPLQLAVVGQAVLVVLGAVALVGGWRRRREDPLPLGAGLLVLGVVAASYALYDVRAHKLVRTALFTLPWAAVGAAAVARPWLARRRVLPGLAVLLLGLAAVVSWREGREMLSTEAESDALVARVQRAAAPGRAIMVDFKLAKVLLALAVADYPTPWSFLAANDETFALVLQYGHDVGTVVLAAQESTLSPDAILKNGLQVVDRLDVEGRAYLILRRPPS